MRFKDQIVAITGGNSGIGLAAAKRFQAEGAKVAIFGRNQETLGRAAKELGDDALAVNGDVTKVADLEVFFEAVKDNFGRLDHLLVNAGVGSYTPIETTTEADFDHIVNINFKGAFFTVQKALPLFDKGGTIAITSSVAGVKGIAEFSVYSATKAAVTNFAKTLSAELIPRGIRVNAVSPGPIETPIFDKMGIPQEQIQGTKDTFADMVPMKRMGTSEEVAGTIAFLASMDGGYILGSDIAVDGGLAQL